jgi:Nucleotidyl transferase of unknown function (DUF2204)
MGAGRRIDSVAPTVPAEAAEFYVHALSVLDEAGIPYLVGGAYAFAAYSKISRDTKDFDLFLMPDDLSRSLAVFEDAGFGTETPFPHWLAKVLCGDLFIDLIFSSGNGVARVDRGWFDHAVETQVLGRAVRLCPAEETIWSKAYVQERERFDGADVMHLLRALGPSLDWVRLIARFGDHWRLLLAHVVQFGFVYPDARHRVPSWVLEELLCRLRSDESEPDTRVCYGTLLSREQYLVDLEQFGYSDARVEPLGRMTEDETAIWTKAITDQKDRK